MTLNYRIKTKKISVIGIPVEIAVELLAAGSVAENKL